MKNTSFTLKDIESLKARAKIRGYTVTPVKGQAPVATKDKKNKYLNEPVEFDGKKFQSTKERDRYITLRMLQNQGEIIDLACQVEFILEVKDGKVCSYIADFTYTVINTGAMIVEDVKSKATRRLAVYRLKNKLMRQCLNIKIKEV